MVLLGELVETTQGNKHLLVITDRFTKLVKDFPLRNIRAQDIPRAFLRHLVFAYRAPLTVLPDNGPQFTEKFLLETYRVFGIQKLLTNAYHPENNGQAERYNRTILSVLRKFVGEHPQSWDRYTDFLSYAYNTQVHETKGNSTFELVVSRPPPSVYHLSVPSDSASARQAHLKWFSNLRNMVEYAQEKFS